MILILAMAFAAACIWASVRRLQYVMGLTAVDAGALVSSLRRRRADLPASTLSALAAAFAKLPEADWEREVVEAALENDARARAGLLAEALSELDFRARRWVRVPRVAASLASSFGFLLATVALRVGLSGLVGALDEATVLTVNDAVFDATDVVSVGLVGVAACVAIHYRAQASLKARVVAAEELVDLCEELSEAAAAHHNTPLAVADPHATVAPLPGMETLSPA